MAQLVDKAKNFVADKVAHIQKPDADVTSVSVKDMSRKAVDFQCDIAISNPYSHDLPIPEITYKFKSANRVLASGTIPDPGSIRANDKTTMNIPMKVPYDFLLSFLKDIGADWDIDYQVDVGLVIDLPVIGNFTIPLSKQGSVRLPTLSDLF